jgi:zinc protease
MRKLVSFSILLAACHFDAPEPNVPGPTTAHPSGASVKTPQTPMTEQRDTTSRVVAIRVAFRSGSADDPQGKEGITQLVATMMAEGGTKDLTYAELTKKLYPLAAHIGVSVDRDETVFETEVAKDGVAELYPLLRDVLLSPRLDEETFRRLKERQTSELTDDLRSASDESLGKEALQSILFEGHPYGHPTQGTETGLAAIAHGDVAAHRSRVFCKDRMDVGIAGAYEPAFAEQIARDMARLPGCTAERTTLPAPKPLARTTVLIVDKPGAEATAISIGHTTDMTRASEDFPAASFVTNYVGMHRQSAGMLYQKLREERGFNYGDYAYAEHFDQDGWSRFPQPNVVRRQQDVSIWIRPVKAKNAAFALKGALYYWKKLGEEGISDPEIARFRTFLSRYLGLELQTDTRRLGYAMDDAAYGLKVPHVDRLRTAFDKLDAAKLKDVINRRFKDKKIAIAIVTPNAAELKKILVDGKPTPPTYDAPKPKSITDEDRIIEKLDLGLKDDDVKIVPADKLFK